MARQCRSLRAGLHSCSITGSTCRHGHLWCCYYSLEEMLEALRAQLLSRRGCGAGCAEQEPTANSCCNTGRQAGHVLAGHRQLQIHKGCFLARCGTTQQPPRSTGAGA